MFGALLRNEIPVRGAISHGTYVSEKTDSGRFVAGRAIIDAYQFEGRQDWIGIMLAPSVVRQVPDLRARCKLEDPSTEALLTGLIARLPWAAFVQPCNQIPFHGAPLEIANYDGFAIVPSTRSRDPAALRDGLLQSLESLRRLRSLAPNPQTQRKHDRSIQWLTGIQREWHLAAFRQEQLAPERNASG